MKTLLSTLLLVLALGLLALPAAAGPKVIVAGEEAAGNAAPQIDLFVTEYCPYCRQAEAYLEAHGLTYSRFYVDKDHAAVKRMMQLTNERAVPFIYAAGHGLTGFSAPAYDKFLQEALGRP